MSIHTDLDRRLILGDAFGSEFEKLNKPQQAAVNHNNGLAVVASTAGSGKTKRLTMRTWRLALVSDPKRILASTFTRAAANEINERLKQYGAPEGCRVGTLHSIAYEILRTDGRQFGGDFTVDDRDRLFYTLKRLLSYDYKSLDFGKCRQFIQLAKAGCLPAPEGLDEDLQARLERLAARVTEDDEQPRTYVEAYTQFEEKRKEEFLLSFDDMLLGAHRTLIEVPGVRERWTQIYDYIMVDEAQDTSTVQWEIVKILAENHGNMMAIGDPAQSIYAFRGAIPEEFVDFTKQEGASVYILPKNYRSVPQIVDPASTLIRGRSWNLTGDIATHRLNETGEVKAFVYANPEEEAVGFVKKMQELHADGVPYGEMALMYRVTSLVQAPETELLRKRIPYRVLSGMTFYERREIKDLLAYLRVAAMQDPHGDNAQRIVNVPFRYVGKKTIEEIGDLSNQMGIAFLDGCQQYRGRKNVRRALDQLLQIIIHANMLCSEQKSAGKVLHYILDRTGYVAWLQRDRGDNDIDVDRAANVAEFVRVADLFPNVPSLLDYVDKTIAAAKMARRNSKAKPDVVTLLTCHRAKGLEWDHVFIVGAVEGIMPHHRNKREDEERRVMYVAVTRARNGCYIGCPKQVGSGDGHGEPSHYIEDMGVEIVSMTPDEEMVKAEGKLQENTPGETSQV